MNDQIIAQQRLSEPTAAAGGLLLLELIHQIDEVEEPAPGAGADHRRGDADAKMRLAAAGAANENRVALGVEKAAAGELAHLAFIDRRIGEDEFIEILEHREFSRAHPIADRPRLSVRAFRPDQAGDGRINLVAPVHALAGDLVKAGAHAVELQFVHRLEDLMTFHQATFLMLS
jgi:hypothetical protein